MSAAAPAPSSSTDPVKRYLLRNPAVAVTLAYLLLTTIGVTFSYMHFSRFGISIFDYWQPSDLVLAGFREPASFLYAAAAIALGIYDYYWQAAQPRVLAEKIAQLSAQRADGLSGWYRKLQLRMLQEQLDVMSGATVPFQSDALLRFNRWARANRVAVQVALGLVIYVGVAFVHTSIRYTRAGTWFPEIQVSVAAAERTVIGDPKVRKQVLIGASNSFLFLADVVETKVTVVPVTSVVSFEVEKHSVIKAMREAFLP